MCAGKSVRKSGKKKISLLRDRLQMRIFISAQEIVPVTSSFSVELLGRRRKRKM